eukprot:10454827-Lingulodinium_polyedra.AAC.1
MGNNHRARKSNSTRVGAAAMRWMKCRSVFPCCHRTSLLYPVYPACVALRTRCCAQYFWTTPAAYLATALPAPGA